jgi:predicted ABC-type ATPase
MKQTAVQEMINIVQMDMNNGVEISMSVFMGMLKKAKEMEKQQIIDFAIWFNYTNTNYQSYEQIIQQYYNETFKK